MAIAWYIAPMKIRGTGSRMERYCGMQDFSVQIRADGGAWSETEVLGNVALVKVRATAGTLTVIENTTGYTRLPKIQLSDPLSDLTGPQKTAILNQLQSMGYTLAELQNRFPGDLGDYTFGDVLRFATTRRLKPRWSGNTIVVDGPEQPCRDVDHPNRDVQ